MQALGQGSARPPDRREWIKRLKAEQARIAAVRRFNVDDGIPFELVVDRVGRHLPDDAIVTVDAGTFGAPVYRVIPFKPPQRLLAPISGAMGFGVPAAVAAGLRAPGRLVVCFAGDGGFLMTGNELAVAKERGLPLKVIVSVNGMYASIRIQQERDYPGRAVGTGFANPDFEAIGRAFGFAVTRLKAVQDLDRLPAVLAGPGPRFVVVDTSVQAVFPSAAKHEGE
jgi:acetolactate synthase-1/2/3 large subunit